MNFLRIASKIASTYHGRYVYRLEDETGLGPYWSDKFPKSFGYITGEEDDISLTTQPFPDQDFTPEDYEYFKQNPHMVFGFTTLSALKKWFPDRMLEAMVHSDIHVVRYEVDSNDEPKLSKSRRQVLFSPKMSSKNYIEWDAVLEPRNISERVEVIPSLSCSSTTFEINDRNRKSILKRIQGIGQLNGSALSSTTRKENVDLMGVIEPIFDYVKSHSPSITPSQTSAMKKCEVLARSVDVWNGRKADEFINHLWMLFSSEDSLPPICSEYEENGKRYIWSPILHKHYGQGEY